MKTVILVGALVVALVGVAVAQPGTAPAAAPVPQLSETDVLSLIVLQQRVEIAVTQLQLMQAKLAQPGYVVQQVPGSTWQLVPTAPQAPPK